MLCQIKHKNERFQGRLVLLLALVEVGGDAGQSGVDLLLFSRASLTLTVSVS